MKIRNGFVSNSSSSSFIVIDSQSPFQVEKYEHNILEIYKDFCCMCFGWDNVLYKDWKQKLVFAYLQTCYAKSSEWLEMLNKVVKEYLGIEDVKWHLDEAMKNLDAYIDHQSNASEGSNIKIFENETILRDFIFRKGSYIQGGNDNE